MSSRQYRVLSGNKCFLFRLENPTRISNEQRKKDTQKKRHSSEGKKKRRSFDCNEAVQGEMESFFRHFVLKSCTQNIVKQEAQTISSYVLTSPNMKGYEFDVPLPDSSVQVFLQVFSVSGQDKTLYYILTELLFSATNAKEKRSDRHKRVSISFLRIH